MASTYNTTKMTVEDIREELTKTFGFPRREIDTIKGKSNLITLLKEAASESSRADVDFGDGEDSGDFVVVTNERNEVYKDNNEQITMDSVGWTDYVISQLDESEKENDNPLTAGLRRITNRLIGPIVESTSEVIQVPTPDNEKRATVKHRIVVEGNDGITRRVDGAADVYYGNTPDKRFNRHTIATCESRAEGRAIRRLLQLRNIIVAEEVGDTSADSFEEGEASAITDAQIRGLQTIAKHKVDINLEKFIIKELGEISNIKQISYQHALQLLEKLSSYQSTPVPEELQKYDEDWQFSLNKE